MNSQANDKLGLVRVARRWTTLSLVIKKYVRLDFSLEIMHILINSAMIWVQRSNVMLTYDLCRRLLLKSWMNVTK